MTLLPLRPCNVDSSLVDGMMQKPNSAITLYLLFLHSIINILKMSLNWLSLSKTGTECLNLDKKWTSTSITCTVWPQDPFSRQNYEPEDVFWYQRITIRSANVPSLLTCYVSCQNVYIEKPNASSCPWPLRAFFSVFERCIFFLRIASKDINKIKTINTYVMP